MASAGTNRAVKIILTLALAASAAGFATSSQFYTEALVDAFFGFALSSIVILHLRVRPRWADALLVLGCTALFAALDFGILRYSPKIMAWFSFLGVSSLLILGIRAVWAEKDDRKFLLYAWVPAVLFISSEWFASTMLEWTARAHPKTLDLYLLSFDASLHIHWSFLAGQWFSRWPWLRFGSLIFYVGLAIPITLVYAGKLMRVGERALPAMVAFLITGPVGILFYNLFPAGGPRNLFQQNFPYHPLPIEQAARLFLEPVAILGPRNAMPSLHMAWTLLAWWYSRGLSWWERAIAFAFVAFTVLATMGTGEHWFVDLVVAYPFSLLIMALSSYSLSWKDSRRLSAFLFGLGGTLAWLAALRYGAHFFWTSPIVPWTLSLATAALASIRQDRLQQAVASVTTSAAFLPGSSHSHAHEVSSLSS
ncbi:MAG: phosphatase PAP2 family protein [Candidatus Acidiferrales bacterium]